MKTYLKKQNPKSQIRLGRYQGFTLVELLVVIAIIAVLAGLGMAGFQRARQQAVKTTAINQMRNIGSLVAIWQSDKAAHEPFFFASGDGDEPDENLAGLVEEFAPGNPGRALFNEDNPNEGLLTDPSLLFSPLTKAVAPDLDDYSPSTGIWGTYVWRHPYVKGEDYNERQRDSISEPVERIDVDLNFSGQLLMHERYLPGISDPKFNGRQFYHGLMLDGSVYYFGESLSTLPLGID